MKTIGCTAIQRLSGAFLLGATWAALGLEGSPQVAMAPARLGNGPEVSSFAAVRPAAGLPAWGQVAVANVNVRWGPGSQHGIITVLHGGDFIRIQQRLEGWLRIEWPPSAPAWVAREFIQSDGRVSGSRVRVRAGGRTNAPVLAELNKNDRVVILDAVGNWYKIQPPADASAYISAKLVILGVAPPPSAGGPGAVHENPVDPASTVSAPAASVAPAARTSEPVEEESVQVASAHVEPVQEVPSESCRPLVETSERAGSEPDAALPPREVKAVVLPPAPYLSAKVTSTPDAVPGLEPQVTPVVPTPVAEPVKVERRNQAPTIAFVQAGPLEEPVSEPSTPSPSATQDTAREALIAPTQPDAATPSLDRDMEDEDPGMVVHTPEQAEQSAPEAHEALEDLVRKVPSVAVLKSSPEQPGFVVVPVDVRAAADQDEFGVLLPAPRFVRERAEAQDVQTTNEAAPVLRASSSGLRGCVPLVFRLPSQSDVQAEFVFLNGKLVQAESGPDGVRYKLVSCGESLALRSVEAQVNLGIFADRQVEILARCMPGGGALLVSAVHPLD